MRCQCGDFFTGEGTPGRSAGLKIYNLLILSMRHQCEDGQLEYLRQPAHILCNKEMENSGEKRDGIKIMGKDRWLSRNIPGE